MRGRTVIFLLSLALIVSVAPELQAQDIRRFGEQPSSNEGGGGGGGGGEQRRFYYPGQPIPQSGGSQSGGQQGARAQQEQSGENKKEEGIEESYAIRIYQPGDYDEGGGQSQQKKQDLPSPVGKSDDKIYQGVIPGMRDTVEHLQKAAAASRTGPNPVTWVGFKAEDKRTRVFIQTARSPQFSRHRTDTDNELTIEIANSKLSERNFARRIDASGYDRVVERVQATEQTDGTVTITLSLRQSESPEISTSGRYLYIDFPREVDGKESQGSSDESGHAAGTDQSASDTNKSGNRSK